MTAGAEDDRPPLVRAERIDSALVVTLDRPDVRNAMNSEVATALGRYLEQADSDDDIRCLIVTGAGDRAFCAGADLGAISRGESINVPDHEEWSFGGFVNHPIRKPTIAAVNGAAVGGGLEIVLACDLAVATPNARFGLTEARRGVVAGGGGAFRLPRRIPPIVAMEMLLTGSVIDADRALELHLVNRIVDAPDLLPAALALAAAIAEGAPLSVEAHKRLARGVGPDGRTAAEEELWHASREAVLRARASADAREGATAFLEKRQPQWSGR